MINILGRHIKGVTRPAGSPTLKTVDELIAAYPSLVKQLEQEVKQTVTDDFKNGGIAAERQRIFKIAGLFFKASGLLNDFKSMVESGMSLDQVDSLTKSGFTAPENSETANLKKIKDDLLGAIKNSGAENPGSAGGTLGASNDFMGQVDAYQHTHNCSKVEALQVIMQIDPKAHKAYIMSVNKHINR